MAVDQHDARAVIHARMTENGDPVRGQFGQMFPMFFNGEKMPMFLGGMYRGHTAFLVGSGPSFVNVDKTLLAKPGVWTVTLNNAIRSFRGNAACIVDDPSRFVSSLWLDPKVMKFVPADHFDKPIWDNRTIVDKNGTVQHRWQPMGIKVGDCPMVIGYWRNEKFHAPRFLKEETVNWGCHKRWGGSRSVLLATIKILYVLGFRRINLVGVDFEMTDRKRYHFDEGRTEAAVNGNMATYSKMTQWFDELKPVFENAGLDVRNCNPDSKLKAFPFVALGDAVADATAHLGDVENERTRGMYSKYEEKIAVWQQIQNGGLTEAQRLKLIDEQEANSKEGMND